MEPFYANFDLSQAQLLPILEGIAGASITDFRLSSSTTENQKDHDKQLVTFVYFMQNGEAVEVTVFVKRCVWKGKPEGIHYHYLAAANVPTPLLYGAIRNVRGEEIIFLEPLTSTGFRDQSEIQWRAMLSLLARFNACPITASYTPYLHPFEQMGQAYGGVWITGLSSCPTDEEIEENLKVAGVKAQALPALKRAACALFAQVQAQPQGLLHQDFMPDNFGTCSTREEMAVFDLHKNSLGPRFADVAPYLSIPNWSKYGTFLDDIGEGTITRREILTQHYLDEYVRFGGAHVLLETFRAEVSALFWAHKVTVLPWLVEQKQQTLVEEIVRFFAQAAVQY